MDELNTNYRPGTNSTYRVNYDEGVIRVVLNNV